MKTAGSRRELGGPVRGSIATGERLSKPRGRVLVMDDDQMVRTVVERMLVKLGHDVVVVEDGKTTIEQYQGAMEIKRPFDVVILDLTIRGGMGGRETIKRLRRIDPEVKAVLSTGYTNSESLAGYQQYGFLAYLPKPYQITDLEEVLSPLLG